MKWSIDYNSGIRQTWSSRKRSQIVLQYKGWHPTYATQWEQTYRMLLLLDLLLSPILESPLYDIRLLRSSLDVLAFGQLGPEVVEVLELDQMPDIGEGGTDDGGFGDGGGRWDTGRHGGLLIVGQVNNVRVLIRYIWRAKVKCLAEQSVSDEKKFESVYSYVTNGETLSVNKLKLLGCF